MCASRCDYAVGGVRERIASRLLVLLLFAPQAHPPVAVYFSTFLLFYF